MLTNDVPPEFIEQLGRIACEVWNDERVTAMTHMDRATVIMIVPHPGIDPQEGEPDYNMKIGIQLLTDPKRSDFLSVSIGHSFLLDGEMHKDDIAGSIELIVFRKNFEQFARWGLLRQTILLRNQGEAFMSVALPDPPTPIVWLYRDGEYEGRLGAAACEPELKRYWDDSTSTSNLRFQ